MLLGIAPVLLVTVVVWLKNKLGDYLIYVENYFTHLTGTSRPAVAPCKEPPAEVDELLLDLFGGQTASTEPALAWLEVLEATLTTLTMLEMSGGPSVTALSSRHIEELSPTRMGNVDAEAAPAPGFFRILSCLLE